MSDCAYGSYSSLFRRDSVNMSGCDYGSSGPICRVMSIAMAFLFLVRVGLANQSRLILVGVAVSFVRVLALATVVVIFSTVAVSRPKLWVVATYCHRAVIVINY